MIFPGTNSKPKHARGDRQRVGPSCRRHSHESHASWGATQGQWARHSPLRRTRKLSNVQESRLGRLNVCCKSRFFAEGGFDMPVTFAKGSGSVSACIRLFPAAGACASREPSETGLPLFVGAAELHGYLAVVNTHPFLQVKIEAYRGTKPPPRNLEFRAR